MHRRPKRSTLRNLLLLRLVVDSAVRIGWRFEFDSEEMAVALRPGQGRAGAKYSRTSDVAIFNRMLQTKRQCRGAPAIADSRNARIKRP